MITSLYISSGGLFEKLDILDVKVRAATRQTSLAVAQAGQGNIIAIIDEKNLIVSGNLRRSIGFQTMGGGKFNIFNFNAIPTPTHRFRTRRVFEDYYFDPPSPPTSVYEVQLFCLAIYGPYLEFGTSRMSARPFFFEGVARTQEMVPTLAIKTFAEYGIAGGTLSFGGAI
jgi:hypothetical protein